VALNDEIVIENLDIFKEVGRGVAHDEGKHLKTRLEFIE